MEWQEGAIAHAKTVVSSTPVAQIDIKRRFSLGCHNNPYKKPLTTSKPIDILLIYDNNRTNKKTNLSSCSAP